MDNSKKFEFTSELSYEIQNKYSNNEPHYQFNIHKPESSIVLFAGDTLHFPLIHEESSLDELLETAPSYNVRSSDYTFNKFFALFGFFLTMVIFAFLYVRVVRF